MRSLSATVFRTASFALLITTTIRAQSPRERLAAVKTLECAFTVNAVATWSNGVPSVAVKPGRLEMRFDTVNTDEGTARVVGFFGPSDITVRLSGDTLHLVQAFQNGPIYTTTVFPKETREGRLEAAHSRHELPDVSLPGYTSSPEQYYGDCQVRP